MSTIPPTDDNVNATGHNNQQVGTEGIVPTVLSKIGLSPSASRDDQPHATDDRGVVAGIGTGAAAATGAAGMAIQQGHGPAAAAAGSLAAAGAAGAAVYGGSRAGANDATAEPAFGASVSPSASRGAYATDSEKAKEVAARATGGVVGYDQHAGSKADYGLDGDAGVRDGRVRDTTGVGAVTGAGTSTGSYQAGNDRLNSSSGFGSAETRSSTTGYETGNDGSTARAGPNPEGARDPTQAGLEGTTDGAGDRKTSRAVEGTSEGAHPSEAKTTAEENSTAPKGGSTRGKLENKDAIPIAGGVKLGEKHWGESEITPDNPKPKPEEQSNVSSAEGQPDR